MHQTMSSPGPRVRLSVLTAVTLDRAPPAPPFLPVFLSQEVGEAFASGSKTDSEPNKVLGTRRRVVQTTIDVTEAKNGVCSLLRIVTSDRPGLLVREWELQRGSTGSGLAVRTARGCRWSSGWWLYSQTQRAGRLAGGSTKHTRPCPAAPTHACTGATPPAFTRTSPGVPLDVGKFYVSYKTVRMKATPPPPHRWTLCVCSRTST